VSFGGGGGPNNQMLPVTFLAIDEAKLRLYLVVVTPLFLLVWAIAMGGTLIKPFKNEDLVWWICKVVGTLLLLALIGFVGMPAMGQLGLSAAFVGLPVCLFSLMGLAVIWRRNLGEMIARPFANLYTGGSAAYEARPVYSRAQARLKRGRFSDAIAEIQAQLEEFPDDVKGHVMLAEVHARNLGDLATAREIIEAYCCTEGRQAKDLVFALYALADWQLGFGRDRAAARATFQQVIDTLPNSDFAANAAQRIAHLGGDEMFPGPEEQRKFVVVEGPRNLGLMRGPVQVKPPEEDPAEAATRYVKHLEAFPLDTEAREKLAVLYAGHYHRLDLATAELEQLVAQPTQPPRMVVHWLNLLADLQVQEGEPPEEVRATLERIIALYPKLAAASLAQNRIALLKLEYRGSEAKTKMKLGVYEQRLGLKAKPSSPPPAGQDATEVSKVEAPAPRPVIRITPGTS